MKPSPPGWPRISSAIYYQDPAAAITWLCRVFGFEVRLKIEGEDGTIQHSELTFGGGLIFVSGLQMTDKYPYRKSPNQLSGANTQNMMVFVDDVDAHFEHARRAGAKIITEPETHDHGEDYWTDRTYECEDLGGHHWWFVQRLRGQKSPG
jgi:uncharacterized glyoxalase superfamily protein PhnB